MKTVFYWFTDLSYVAEYFVKLEFQISGDLDDLPGNCLMNIHSSAIIRSSDSLDVAKYAYGS